MWVFGHVAAINAQRARWLRAAGTDGELLHAVVERQVAQIDPVEQYLALLRIVEASNDATAYGPAHDFGRWGGTSYAGQSNLPPGYWVYIYPNWYIWGDTSK